jgi:hypothetical protein
MKKKIAVFFTVLIGSFVLAGAYLWAITREDIPADDYKLGEYNPASSCPAKRLPYDEAVCEKLDVVFNMALAKSDWKVASLVCYMQALIALGDQEVMRGLLNLVSEYVMKSFGLEGLLSDEPYDMTPRDTTWKKFPKRPIL